MRILIIGGHGTIGRAVAAELDKTHEVIRVGLQFRRLAGRPDEFRQRAGDVRRGRCP